jgi:methylmalonyl-CoA mutase cobalamin-binding domain/chain
MEMLLAIRRVGSKRLEELFGPGEAASGSLRGRKALVRSHSIEQLEEEGEGLVSRLSDSRKQSIENAELCACIATTDVHEYGKVLIETVLRKLGVRIVDGGTSTDPNDLAARACSEKAHFIALSSYNGVALQFVSALKEEMRKLNMDMPVFIGGKLNRVPEGSNTSLPVDISDEVAQAGALVCPSVETMLGQLAEIAQGAIGRSTR